MGSLKHNQRHNKTVQIFPTFELKLKMANSGGWVLPVTQQPGDPANSAVQQPPAYGVPGQTLGMSTFGGPLGLNCLAQVDHLIVRQKRKTVEMFTSWSSKNKYDISDNAGTELFKAEEHSETWDRQCWGAARAFDMMIEDLQGNVLIQLNRPFAYCDQDMSVWSPPENNIGSITQEWAAWSPKYTVKDQEGNVAFIIEGPHECCYCSCGEDIEFKVYTADGATEIGKVSKKWRGFFSEAIIIDGCDIFGINFPKDLDVTKKALLLGATFLIDYNFFERNSKGKRQRHSKTIGPKLILLGIFIVLIIASWVMFGFFTNARRSNRYG